MNEASIIFAFDQINLIYLILFSLSKEFFFINLSG